MEKDSMKLIYARMMFAAMPMFEKLTPHEQAEVVQNVANTLMGKIQRKAECDRDSHILIIPDEAEESKRELTGAE